MSHHTAPSTSETYIRIVWDHGLSALDTAMDDWVAGALFTMGSLMAAVATLCLVLLAWRAATGGNLPVPLAVGQVLHLCIVTAAAGFGGMYYDWVADVLRTLPLDVAATMSSTLVGAGDVPSALAATIDPVVRLLTAAIGSGILESMYAVLLLAICIASMSCAFVMLFATQIGLALLTAIGPFVIVGTLFQVTRDMFAKWLGYVITLGLTGAFVLLIVAIGTELSAQLAAELKDTGDLDGVPVAGAASAMVVMGFAYLMCGSIASSIGGGVNVALGSGIMSAYGTAVGGIATAGALAGAKAAAAPLATKAASAVAGSSLGIKAAAGRVMAGEAAAMAQKGSIAEKGEMTP